MDLRELFATNLRRIRHGRKLSQEQLAHDAGVDRAYMSRVERAVTWVGLEIIGKLADVLEVDPVEFFRRPSRPTTRKKAE
ncbi:helix-turn-helix transcriptional regulator [Bradyrhizobium septentrionale]|uniref:Helix-turn-helix transcriptional regulator n=1 Tax=Bradyrhizobium septentrionale TaxID=1404411 RepID=A0ABZ2NYS2_9BRAD